MPVQRGSEQSLQRAKKALRLTDALTRLDKYAVLSLSSTTWVMSGVARQLTWPPYKLLLLAAANPAID